MAQPQRASPIAQRLTIAHGHHDQSRRRARVQNVRVYLSQGILSIGRRLFWSWWPWAIVSLWATSDGRWGWALGCGVMAVHGLLTPAADPPRFGLEHEFRRLAEIRGRRGAPGNPFLPGNRLEVLNNGDAFYPSMLCDQERPKLDHRRGVYLLGRRHRKGIRHRASGTYAGRQARERAGRHRVIEYRPGDSGRAGSGRLPVALSLTQSIGTRSDDSDNRTHRKSLIIDGRIAFTGGAGIADLARQRARARRVA